MTGRLTRCAARSTSRSGRRPQLVFALARDVERWERLLPHYARVAARSAARPDGSLVVSFVARRPLIERPRARAAGHLEGPHLVRARTLRLRFRHVAGATRGMDVTWRIEPAGDDRTRVSIEHDFRPRVPFFATFVDRAFTRPIAGRTLGTFKALAEALQAGGIADADGPPA